MSSETIELDIEELLERRAEQLAQARSDEAHESLVVDVAVLAVGNERFGIPAAGLREIVPAPPITPLPHLPDLLRGIAQIRGELISVVDAAKVFFAEAGAGRYLAVVEGDAGAVGLLADELLGFRSLVSEEIADGFANSSSGGRPVQAMTKDFLWVLDVEALLGNQELIVDQK